MTMSVMAFLLPLGLLPGVGLLINSTVTRFGQFHDELHHLLDEHKDIGGQHLRQRARQFHHALVSLYLCVAILVLAGVVGVLLELAGTSGEAAIVALTTLASLFLLYAAYQLLRGSFLSLEFIQRHLDQFEAGG